MTFDRRLILIRFAFLGMGLSSIPLGGWMVLAPNGFWQLMGAPAAGDAGMALSVRAVYGGAICGEAVILTLGYFRPLQYLSFFHYMMAYKTAACLALAPRLIGVEPVPLGGWAVLFGWAAAGVIAALAYPWGQRDEVLRRMQQPAGDRS